LGDAATIVNVGAGAGSYEPADRLVVALEPSSVMLDQHPGPRRVRGVAEALPFPDGSFDAAMAVLTVHHWRDRPAGLSELRRVARRQVLLAFDSQYQGFWLDEYLPPLAGFDDSGTDQIASALDICSVEVVPVPHDCTDGFLAAYWRRPECYLDPAVRASISGLALLPDRVITQGIARLAADLESGRWADRHRELLASAEMDYGYRLIVAGPR
jgi:SAM-dependent methyltransferase